MTETAAVPYKSRRGGLIFFGLVELAMAALCLLIVGFTTIGLFLAAAPSGATVPIPPWRQMVVSVAMYLTGAIVLGALGVGSMLARRWARDLSLVVAWFWLLIGIVTTTAMVFMVPRLIPAITAEQAGTIPVVLTCMAVVFGFFGVLIPAAMILFYRSPHVRATCLALDPHPRWTERVPLPLLGLSMWMLFTALCITAMSMYGVLPLGGRIVTGAIAVITYCALGLLLFYVSWGLYRQNLAAWWIGLGYGIVAAVYCVVVFPRLDYPALMKAMQVPATPGMPDLADIYRSPWFLAYLGLIWIVYFGYFVFVYRYFRQEPIQAQ